MFQVVKKQVLLKVLYVLPFFMEDMMAEYAKNEKCAQKFLEIVHKKKR